MWFPLLLATSPQAPIAGVRPPALSAEFRRPIVLTNAQRLAGARIALKGVADVKGLGGTIKLDFASNFGTKPSLRGVDVSSMEAGTALFMGNTDGRSPSVVVTFVAKPGKLYAVFILGKLNSGEFVYSVLEDYHAVASGSLADAKGKTSAVIPVKGNAASETAVIFSIAKNTKAFFSVQGAEIHEVQ